MLKMLKFLQNADVLTGPHSEAFHTPRVYIGLNVLGSYSTLFVMSSSPCKIELSAGAGSGMEVGRMLLR